MSTTSLEQLLGDEPPDRARVTSHAIFSYQSREDPTDPYSAATLRGLWRQSNPSDHLAAREAQGLYLIYDVDPRGCKRSF